MLLKLSSIKKFFVFFCLFSLSLKAWALPTWEGSKEKRIKEYLKLHKNFSRAVCSPGSDQKFYRLLKRYRGSGFYLPLLGNDIDRKAISENLFLYDRKLRFIRETRQKLEKLKTLPNFDHIAKPLKDSLRNLLNLKKDYSRSSEQSVKKLALKRSAQELKKLMSRLDAFTDEIFFLKSFGFPNDHLANRRDYEAVKDKEDLEGRKAANKIFFRRKIVEDGTYNAKTAGSDLFLRSTLDTLYLETKRADGLISDNLRYDLEWILSQTEKVLERNLSEQSERLKEWEERTLANLNFYKDIINVKNKDKAKKLAREKNQASHDLRDYVYQKQAQTYKWWMKQTELMRAVYVLETILFNEVGRVDGKDALERADVAQIVLNRVEDSFYSSLDPGQELIARLDLGPEVTQNYRWLNTLFRVGEFSFTYHYISSVVKIFCPDMSWVGRKLRNENIAISLEALNNKKNDFNVYRYFSRVSMLGKIDMSTVWTGYDAYPERPGPKLKEDKSLIRLYLAGRYQFMYAFTSPSGEDYQVIRVAQEVYVVRLNDKRPVFYKYRDPHLFKYFSKK